MPEQIDLFAPDGARKYLTSEERGHFLATAAKLPNREHRMFALTLTHLGCRISEALALTPQRIDLAGSRIVIATLKKRGRSHQRAVPVPTELLDALDLVFGLRSRSRASTAPLWTFSRSQGWRIIKAVMQDCGFERGDPKACPKGLRHAFAIHALMNNVPLTSVRTWLGHSRLETTAIYLDVGGTEERQLAERMWQ